MNGTLKSFVLEGGGGGTEEWWVVGYKRYSCLMFKLELITTNIQWYIVSKTCIVCIFSNY